MQRPASCEFLCGPLTSQQSVAALRDALNDSLEKHAELLYYKKDGVSPPQRSPNNSIFQEHQYNSLQQRRLLAAGLRGRIVMKRRC
ncbi:hypothetical protein Trydic_g18348 [Trypoxylus dichotomus]